MTERWLPILGTFNAYEVSNALTNRQDRSRHGRDRRTHCPANHAYTEANTYVAERGDRMCRTCHRTRQAARYRQKLEALGGAEVTASQPVAESPEGYLARAKAVFKIGRHEVVDVGVNTLGEFLHRADIEGV